MSSQVLLDNDVLLKASCYRVGEEVLHCLRPAESIAALPVAKFVLARAIDRSANIINKTAVAQALHEFLAAVSLVEPEEIEIVLAAEFESEAQARALPLDPGESLLLAILVYRQTTLMITGDKRAIRCFEPIIAALNQQAKLAGRVACIEQLVMQILPFCGAIDLHTKVCNEPHVDKALSICFSCSTGAFSTETATAGLISYIRNLRNEAGEILVPSCDLSSMIS